MDKTKVRNKAIGSAFAIMSLGGTAATALVPLTAFAADADWGSASDDKTVGTIKNLKSSNTDLLKQEHVDYSQSTPFLVPMTFPNDTDLKSAGFSDDLVEGLVFDSVKVYKLPLTVQSDADVSKIDLSKATDITDHGTMTKNSNGFKWMFKDAKEAFGQSFVLEIQAHIAKDGTANLTQYADDNGVIHIPNVAHQYINNNDIPTPKTTEIPPKTVKPDIDKKILDSDGKEVTSDQVDFNKDYQYIIHNQVGSNTKLDKVVSADDLENVIKLKSVKIVEGDKATGKDISSEFEITIDHDKESYTATPKDPTAFANREFSVVITGQLQNTTDLMNYLKNGKVQVPNKATLDVNDKTYTTPDVIVTPPDVKNVAQKYIEKTSATPKASSKEDASKSAAAAKSDATKNAVKAIKAK